MGSYQITQSQGPDQLLPGTTELFGSHDDRKINRNSLISTTGISHHRFFTTVHPSIGSCGGTNQGIVQKVVFQQPFVLLNCAGFHASDRGFGIATLNEDNYTWVLSRLAVELDEMPYQYENFSVQTWVENVYRLFTDRNFAIINKDGKKIGYARSVWAMISLNTRKPADLLTLHGGSIVDYVCDEPCPIEKPSRIKVTSDRPVATLTAKYSDIDINGHVNSIRYIEHILDLFPIDLYKTKRIRRFEMAYVAESYFGDELSFFCDEANSNEFHVEVKKNGSEVVCRSKVIFE